MIRMALVLLLASFVVTFLQAMTPISPKLEDECRNQLIQSLLKVGMAETQTSAVLRTLEAVLADGKQDRERVYDEPYEHLPMVDAKSKKMGAGRMRVEASSWMRSKPDRKIVILGSFQLTEKASVYEWKSHDLRVDGGF